MSVQPTNLAPVALFVYNRPDHARRALQSLLDNPDAATSAIRIYCDGPRSNGDVELVEATRRAVRGLARPDVRIVEQERNCGLANSIIGGVSELCAEHGRVIVVEDDLILSRAALRFLNMALDRYRDEERVMHVSAYMFPVRRPLPPAFFYREATCWGWATWASAWRRFEKDPAVIQEFVTTRSLISEFNVRDSMYFWEMLKKQAEGHIDSWAIRWYGSMFMHGGLALHPGRSLVQNEGFDGTGVHCSITDEFDVDPSDVVPSLPDDISECEEAVQAMMEYRSRGTEQRRARSMFDFLRRAVSAMLTGRR
jgi:hypothetical protein